MTGNECELLFMKQVEGRQAAIWASKLTWVALKFSRAFQWTEKSRRRTSAPPWHACALEKCWAGLPTSFDKNNCYFVHFDI